MSVVDFSTGDKFVIRVFKHLTTNPSNVWANSYEAAGTTTGGLAELTTLGEVISTFERLMHSDTVQFDRYVISTWEPDSVPYDPLAFLTQTLSFTGEVTFAGQAVPLNQCLKIARIPTSGRAGHLFYRGCVEESDVEAPAGFSVFTNPATFTDRLDAALGDSALSDYVTPSPGGPLVVCMISADGATVRTVSNLVAQGMTTLPTDHAWFNRT